MKSSNVLLTAIGSLAVGAIAGILLAPGKGSETRKKISDKAGKLSGDIKDNVGDLATKASEAIEEAKEKSLEFVNENLKKANELKEQAISNQN